MSRKARKSDDVPQKPAITLPGKVEKIIRGVVPAMPDKAQISVEGAEDLYKEIRIENKLQDENGKSVTMKPGAEVEVTIEAEKGMTEPKPDLTKLPSDEQSRK